MAHANALAVAFFDQRHRSQRRLVVHRRRHVFHVHVVDLEDDLHVARQQIVHQADRPGLQGLGQQRVVGVVQRVGGDPPRLRPGETRLVEQQPHQLGDGDRGMRVVHVDRGVIGQGRQRLVQRQMAPHQVLQRGRGEEVFLAQPQRLAGRRLVAGVEHAGDRLGVRARGEGADVVAAVEGGEFDRVDGARRPQPQRVGVLPLPADDRRVIGGGQHRLARVPDAARRILVADDLLDIAAEADGIDELRSLEFPRVAVGQPIFRHLVLPAVGYHLTKQPEIVADAVAVGGQADTRHALHEAGGEPAEAAVAERGVGFLLADLVEIDAKRRKRVARRLGEAEVGQAIEQQATDQEFDGEIVDGLAVGLMRAAAGAHPAVDDPVAHGERQGGEPVARARGLGILADRIDQLGQDGLTQLLAVHRRGRQGLIRRVEFGFQHARASVPGPVPTNESLFRAKTASRQP